MYKISVIYILFSLCLMEIFAMDEEMQALLDNLHNTCTGETGTTDDKIANARKGDFADDEDFKCYFKCLFDQMGCMNDDGTVDAEAVVAIMPPDLAAKIENDVKSCKDVGASACETAWLAHKCYQAKNPDLYFLP